MLDSAIEKYLQDVLGITAAVRPWPARERLPFYLQSAYRLAAIDILGKPYVLMQTAGEDRSAAEVRKHLDRLAELAGAVGIYVVPALSSFERKRLIQQRVPFIVPSNQLYLPDLGIDLREYFRRSLAPAGSLSPATQAVLISTLLRPWQAEMHPAAIGEQLGYTPMTVSRAVRELAAANLADVVGIGRERWLRFADDPRAVWQQALPLLRSPVRRTEWAAPEPFILQQARLAGESALAARTLLAEPAQPVYAVSAEAWKLAQRRGVRPLPPREPGAYQWQIWRYSPALESDRPVVDPLSLILSLREESDERIGLALEELEEQLPW